MGLKRILCIISMGVLIGFYTPPLSVAETIIMTGTVEVVYNKGNGLNQYYLITPSGKVRVWAHILDSDQDAKEKLLEKAAEQKRTVIISGDKEVTTKETTIRIKQVVIQ